MANGRFRIFRNSDGLWAVYCPCRSWHEHHWSFYSVRLAFERLLVTGTGCCVKEAGRDGN